MDRFEASHAGSPAAISDAAVRVTAFLRVVYGWMAVGLTVTAVVAWMVAGSDALIYTIASNRLLFWGIFGAQLGVVIFLSARVHKLAPGTAAALFLGYSALTGLTMAFVLRVYTGESVATTFFITAAPSARWRFTARSPRGAWPGWGSSCSWASSGSCSRRSSGSSGKAPACSS